LLDFHRAVVSSIGFHGKGGVFGGEEKTADHVARQAATNALSLN
jgi:hypothetical protein